MRTGRQAQLRLTCQYETNVQINNSEVRAEQVTNAKYEVIYLGVDLHKQSISVTRII
jgi:hypothetical protein